MTSGTLFQRLCQSGPSLRSGYSRRVQVCVRAKPRVDKYGVVKPSLFRPNSLQGKRNIRSVEKAKLFVSYSVIRLTNHHKTGSSGRSVSNISSSRVNNSIRYIYNQASTVNLKTRFTHQTRLQRYTLSPLTQPSVTDPIFNADRHVDNQPHQSGEAHQAGYCWPWG